MDHFSLVPYSDTLIEINLGFMDLTIKWYAFFILTGAFIALFLGMRIAKKFGINPDLVFNGFVWGLVIAIIGGRLYYVIFEWSRYKDNLIDILKIYEGGLAIHGSIIATVIFVYFYAKKHKLDVYVLIEMVTPGFLLAQAVGRWGNFMNQEAHGPIIDEPTLDLQRAFLSDKLHLPDFITNQMFIRPPSVAVAGYYHPTFLYESLWNIAGVIIILLLRKYKNYWIGDAIAIYLIWYSIGRFFIEALRTDSLMLGSIKVAQLISIVLILVGIAVLVLRRVFKIRPKSYIDSLKEATPYGD